MATEPVSEVTNVEKLVASTAQLLDIQNLQQTGVDSMIVYKQKLIEHYTRWYYINGVQEYMTALFPKPFMDYYVQLGSSSFTPPADATDYYQQNGVERVDTKLDSIPAVVVSSLWILFQIKLED